MISYTIQTSTVSTAGFIGTAKMTDLSVVSACSLGLSASALIGTGLPVASLPVTGLSGLGAAAVAPRNERPTKALEAGVAGKATTYGFAATGAGTQQQTTTQHHMMWAFRGLEPWSDPV
ncbi:hypothetical protein GCM10010275_03240 [Streptomyces litmocidini]|uniref:hypothetical protein n=1 Tax=Streptomyces litmocidini TaxID=67318 RepID=UPI00167E9AAD|nr:hypothetical protein [Streptomyces litmocidini]GGU72170.1 hypothetical protein GCM10010275_03240 [Streptomyces litmocidini]